MDLTKEKQVDQLAELFDLNTVLIVCSGIKKQYGDNLDIFNTNIHDKQPLSLLAQIPRPPRDL